MIESTSTSKLVIRTGRKENLKRKIVESSKKFSWVTFLVTFAFLAVPMGSSFVSLHHVKEFIALGNPDWMAWFMSIIYEVASIAILVAIVRLDKLNPFYIWTAFFVVTFIQILGNAYFIYDFVKNKVVEQDDWISNFVEFSGHIFPLVQNETRYIFILSCILGISIPLLSLLLTKGATDYLRSRRENDSSSKHHTPDTIDNNNHMVEEPENDIENKKTEVVKTHEGINKPEKGITIDLD